CSRNNFWLLLRQFFLTRRALFPPLPAPLLMWRLHQQYLIVLVMGWKAATPMKLLLLKIAHKTDVFGGRAQFSSPVHSPAYLPIYLPKTSQLMQFFVRELARFIFV